MHIYDIYKYIHVLHKHLGQPHTHASSYKSLHTYTILYAYVYICIGRADKSDRPYMIKNSKKYQTIFILPLLLPLQRILVVITLILLHILQLMHILLHLLLLPLILLLILYLQQIYTHIILIHTSVLLVKVIYHMIVSVYMRQYPRGVYL